MKRILAVIAIFAGLAACRDPKPPVGPDGQLSPPFVVFDSAGVLGAGLDIFVNTDRGITDWLGPPSDGRLAAYPPGQQFGFVAAVMLGDPTPGRRQFKDMRAYRTLQFELRGAAGGEVVEVGIKDDLDPDNGSETKVSVTVSQAWTPHSYPLATFTTADLSRIYLLFELVFNGTAGRSVSFRNVRYTAP